VLCGGWLFCYCERGVFYVNEMLSDGWVGLVY